MKGPRTCLTGILHLTTNCQLASTPLAAKGSCRAYSLKCIVFRKSSALGSGSCWACLLLRVFVFGQRFLLCWVYSLGFSSSAKASGGGYSLRLSSSARGSCGFFFF